MLYHEPLFIFFILPPILIGVLLLRNAPLLRISVLSLISIGIYAWSEPRFIPVVFASLFLDVLFSRRLYTTLSQRWRRFWLWAAVVQNLGIIFYYKYLFFTLDTLSHILPISSQYSFTSLVLPIGISFIVFEKISYVADVYRGLSKPVDSHLRYIFYVFFFPKLQAGPIIKYHEIESRISNPTPLHFEDIQTGFARFMLGAAKKLLLADPLGAAADLAFAQPDSSIGFSTAWLGVVFFTLQIYFDFSGYSDMAIGLARMLGFRLTENFSMPYIAQSLTEFWRRWHISLSTYIRDYLYIPLGGGRGPAWRVYVNLWICFLVSGLWHGAAWNFLAWGLYNGLFLTLDRFFLLRMCAPLAPWLRTLLTFIVVMFGWAIFRATSFDQMGVFLTAMLNPFATSSTLRFPPDAGPLAIVGLVLCLGPRFVDHGQIRSAYFGSAAVAFAGNLALAGIFVLACARTVSLPFTPFLYFRF